MVSGNLKRNVVIVLAVVVLTLAGIQGMSAWNARVTPEKIAAGKILFEHEWTVDDALCGSGDGLGPVFNGDSCVVCHFQGGVGGSSGNKFNVTSFDVISQNADAPHRSGVVHEGATKVAFRETKEIVNRMFPAEIREITVLESGGAYGASCEPSPDRERTIEQTHDPVFFHELNSPALFGVGLIDEIANLSVTLHGHKRMARKLADELSGDFEGNRLGMINMVNGSVGKFGWKGQFASLEDFVASACAMEIGLTNHKNAQQVPTEHRADDEAKMDMTRKQLHELVCFVRSISRPEQIMPDQPAEIERVKQGEEAFMNAGCADCHVPEFSGISQIYSDFHLYNLEPLNVKSSDGYSDGTAEEEFDFDRSHPHPDQWQTPALWGVADSAPYFHDGASPTLLSAIERHKGQANSSLQRFQKLSTNDRDCLIEFMMTLKAPVTSKSDGARD